MVKMVGSEKLDTASSIEYIDGVAFNKFHIATSMDNEVQLHMYLMNNYIGDMIFV